MAAQENNSAVAAVSGFFKAIGGFFADFGTAVVKGDAFVKLSLIWMGAGYAKRKQYVKAALMTCLLYTSPSPRDRTRSRMPSSA